MGTKGRVRVPDSRKSMCQGPVVLGVMRKQKLLQLDQIEHRQGVGDASGRVSRTRDTYFVKVLPFSLRAMGSC